MGEPEAGKEKEQAVRKILLVLLVLVVAGCAAVWQIAQPGMELVIDRAVRYGVAEAEKEVGAEVGQEFEDALVKRVQEEMNRLLEPQE